MAIYYKRLKEDGNYRLLETGDKRLLENYLSETRTITVNAQIAKQLEQSINAHACIQIVSTQTVTAKAETHMFVELVDSNTYKDAGATTADWDLTTERIYLPKA